MANIETLVEELGKLTVLEAVALVKQLEEHWGVSAAAPVGVAHDIGHLTGEVGTDVRHARFGESLAHVSVFGDGAVGTTCAETIAEFRELLHGEAGVIDDDQVGRRVDAIQQAVDDDFLIWIHMRWRTVD